MTRSAAFRLLLAALLSSPSLLHATGYRWDLGVSGTWGSAYFWDPSSGFPNGVDDDATISATGEFGNAYDVHLDGNYSVDQFTHNAFDASFQATGRVFTVHGDSHYGGGSMIFTNSSYTTHGTFTHGLGPFDLISSHISGSGSFNKQGGTLNMRRSSIDVPANQDDGNILMLGSTTFGGQFDNNGGTLDLFGQTDVSAHTTLNLGANDLNNAGTIKMRTDTADVFVPNISISGSGTLTNTGSIIIEEGAGGLRELKLTLDNQGTLTSETSVTIARGSANHSNTGSIITSTGDIVVSNALTFTNSNQIQATTGNVRISGTSGLGSQFTNNTGAGVSAGGNLTLSGFRTIDNDGSLTPTGNALITGASYSTTSFDHAGTLSVGPGHAFTMTTGDGSSQLIIQPGSSFNPGDALNLTRVNLVLNQDLNLGSSDLNLSIASTSGGGTLTRGSGSTADLTATTLNASFDTAGLTTFTGNNNVGGALTNRSTGTVQLNPGAVLKLDTNDFTNEGTLDLLAGTITTQLAHRIPGTSTASFVNAASGTVVVNGTGIRSFNLPVVNHGLFNLLSSTSWNRNGATQANHGTITATGTFQLNNAGMFTNSGTITSTGGNLNFDGNSATTAAFLNSGTITGQNGILIVDFETMTNDNLIDLNAGTLTVTIGEYGNPQSFANNGQIDLAPGTIGNFTKYGDGGSLVLADGSTLDGGGAVNISYIGLSLGGDYSPGTSPVTLTNVSVSGAGALMIDSGNTLATSGTTLAVPTSIDGAVSFTGSNSVNAAITNETTGTITLNNSATLTIRNEDFTNHGLFEITPGINTTTVTSTDRTIVNSSTGTINIPTGTGNRYLTLDLDNQGHITADSVLHIGANGRTCNNSGTITTSAPLSTSHLEDFTNSGTITSTGGSLTLDGNSSGTATFLNTGTITGQNGIAITDFETATNDSLIDVAAGTLAVTLGEYGNPQAFVNTGQIDLAPGTTASFTKAGDGGSLTLADGSTLDGGGAINISYLGLSVGGAYSPNTSPLTLTSSSLSGPGTLHIMNGSTLTSSSSTFAVPATIHGDAAFSGSSRINAIFDNQTDGTFTLANSSTLTINNQDFTNHGSFKITAGANTTTITSTDRTFVNTPAGTITIQEGTGERYLSLNLDNQGQLTTGSVLRFNRSGGTFTNSGTISASADLAATSIGSFSNSGTIDAIGGGLSIDGNGGATAAFLNTGTITANRGITIADFETMTNDHNIDLLAGTLAVTLGEYGNPQAFVNTGQIDLAPGTTASFTKAGDGGSLTLADGSTLDGGGAINISYLGLSLGGAYSPDTSPLTLTSSSLSGPGALHIIDGSTLTSSGSTYAVPATIHGDAAFSGSNTIKATFDNQTDGTFTLGNNSTLTINNQDFTNHGLFEISAGANISTVTSTAQALVNAPTGTINIPAGTAERRLSLSLDNQGQVTADSNLRVNRSGGSLTNTGTITAASEFTSNGLADLTNFGSITVGAKLGITNLGGFTNSGTIATATATGSLSFDGNNAPTAAFLNTGNMTSANGISIADFETATNDSLIDLNAGALAVTLGEYNNPQAFVNTGQIDLAPGTTANFAKNGDGGSVTLADGSSLDGGGTISITSLGLFLGGAYSPNTSALHLSGTSVSGAGSLTIIDGSTLASSGSTYGVPTTIDGNATFSGNSRINATFRNQTDGTFTLGNSSTLTITNADFTNHGLFEMAAGVNISTVTSTAQTLVNAPGGSINIPAGTAERRLTLSLDNQGLLTTGSVLRINRSGGTCTNSGTITASALLAATSLEGFSNSGAITITGGNLSIDGNGSATSLFDNAGTITADSGVTLTDFETMTNNSLIDLNGGTLAVTLGENNNPQAFTNTGMIDLAPGSAATFTGNGSGGGSLTLGDGSTLEGGGTLAVSYLGLSIGGAWSSHTSPLTLTSTKLSGAGSLTVIDGGSLTSSGSTYNVPATLEGDTTFSGSNTLNTAFNNESTATFTLANNANLTINNEDFTNHGLFEITGGAQVTSVTSTTQAFVNTPTGTIAITAGTGERRFTLALNNQGLITADSVTSLNQSHINHINSGTISNSARISTSQTESFANSGRIVSTGGELSFDGNRSTSSLFENTGTITSSNGLTIKDFENVNNSGFIDLASGNASVNLGINNNPQQFTNTGEIRIAAGSTFSVNNTWSASATNAAGGRITGAGTFNHTTASFTNHGILAPGFSPGILTVSPDLTNSATAEFEIEIVSADGPGLGHDQLQVTGDLVLDGILKPRLVAGYVPLPSDTFLIMTADGDITGDFASIDQPDSFGTWSVTIDEDNDEVTISFAQTGALSFGDFQDLYFTPTQIANGDADAESDFDGDGISTALEWVYGMNPLIADQPAAIITAAPTADDPDGIDLSYPQSILLAGDLKVGIQTLVSAPWNTIAEADISRVSSVPIPGYPNVHLVTLRVTNPIYRADPARLFRLTFDLDR